MRSLIIAIISFITLTATGCDFSRDNATGTDVVVLGDFHTMDPNQPRAEAIAIADGRFSFVGAENK
ncbi:MAG: hypothetical protein VW806_07795, partial [Halieaceae bacterium]